MKLDVLESRDLEVHRAIVDKEENLDQQERLGQLEVQDQVGQEDHLVNQAVQVHKVK